MALTGPLSENFRSNWSFSSFWFWVSLVKVTVRMYF
jgi:hypothetical protein